MKHCADFEGGVRNLMHDWKTPTGNCTSRTAIWKLARWAATARWKPGRRRRRSIALVRRAVVLTSEAQARSQYFLFRSQVEQALTDVFRDENRLRYIMGLIDVRRQVDSSLPTNRRPPAWLRLGRHSLRSADPPRGNPPREVGNQTS